MVADYFLEPGVWQEAPSYDRQALLDDQGHKGGAVLQLLGRNREQHCHLARLHLWVEGQGVTVPGPPQASVQAVQGVREEEEVDRLLDGGLAARAGHH